jgi:sodium transport system permease protein
MNFSSVFLIFRREFRDQIRDRRTLFTIVVLPIFLYPMLGMLFLQITQFMQQSPTRIRMIGAAHLPQDPPLLDGDHFSSSVLSPELSQNIELDVFGPSLEADNERRKERVEEEINRGEVDAVVFIPASFATQLADFRAELEERQQSLAAGNKASTSPMPELPQPTIIYNAASDKSVVARDRIQRALDGWRELMAAENLASSQMPVIATRPFEVHNTDVALPTRRRAAMWSKVLPFIVLIWALTGAFYPAIDLCAGEKERGTLETLLSGPALRTEIVWGKLLTVMTFSIGTAALNMISLGLTASLLMRQFAAAGAGHLAPPPISALLWLCVAIVPCAALFSALALAIASFAKSSKEGQYYLLPLLMLSLPLMMLSLLPTAQLSLGTSLIPLTGLMLLVRVAIEGRIMEAITLVPVVAAVTGLSCHLAIQWAVAQFQNENVLFRESEQVSLFASVRNIRRNRVATPTMTHAFFGGFLFLVIRFGASTFATAPSTWGGFARMLLTTQLLYIALPALLLTFLFTNKRLKTLALESRPIWWTIPAAALAACCLHPAAIWLHHGIAQVYPTNQATMEQLQPLQMILQNAPLIQVLLVIALVPAVCEELAFRGFLLTGFRRKGGDMTAILLASVFFGVTHGMLQQSIFAAVIGVVIGIIAIRTGSILPGIAFHFTNNAIVVITSRFAAASVLQSPLGRLVYDVQEKGGKLSIDPHLHVAVIGVLLAVLIVGRLRTRAAKPVPVERTPHSRDLVPCPAVK